MRYDLSALGKPTSAQGRTRSADVHSTTDPLSGLAVAHGAAFASPAEVLASGDLTQEEKRAILASWASDAWAVESAPALRRCPFGGPPVQLDDVLAALRALDAELSERAPATDVIRTSPARSVQPTRVRPLRAMHRRVLH